VLVLGQRVVPVQEQQVVQVQGRWGVEVLALGPVQGLALGLVLELVERETDLWYKPAMTSTPFRITDRQNSTSCRQGTQMAKSQTQSKPEATQKQWKQC